MSKNRSAYVVIAVVLAVLCFYVAWSQYGRSPAQASAGAQQTGLLSLTPAQQTDGAVQAADSQALSLTPAQQANGAVQAESKDVNIVIDGNKAAGSDVGTNDAAQGAGDEKKAQNPVAEFFGNLAAKIKGGSSDAPVSDTQAQQVSIEVGNENEITDPDVTNQVHIDVEKYPVQKSGNAAVLIYHTHTTEAYTPDYTGEYTPVGDIRTSDIKYSVCAVGQKITDLLTNQYGFSVVHDTTNNETTPFTASYDKSLQTEQADIAKNPNLGVFIDVHRDSIDDMAFAAKDIVTKDGKQYARVMFVVGRGDGYTGAEAPNWQANYAVAKAVSDQINKLMPGLSRGIMVKAKRYNQQLSTKSMLIEVGYNANTLTEANNSAEIVAKALATILGK